MGRDKQRWRWACGCGRGFKVAAWYSCSAALLVQYPLSNASSQLRRELPDTANLKNQDFRDMSRRTEVVATYKYKGKWTNVSKDALGTYYDDRNLHQVGELRMKEWWSQRSSQNNRVGCALTFWFALDGSTVLPDAIAAGLKSTLLGEFDDVFILTYQPFENLPEHIRVLDCNRVHCVHGLREMDWVKPLRWVGWCGVGRVNVRDGRQVGKGSAGKLWVLKRGVGGRREGDECWKIG